jgi:nucleoside-diphosphate-sugar epimerase
MGATSLVGDVLLPLLAREGLRPVAFSRSPQSRGKPVAGVEWRLASLSGGAPAFAGERIEQWVSLAPIWSLPEHFGMLEGYGARKVVALSSTSIETRRRSDRPMELDIARRLEEGEERLNVWAQARGMCAIILRPTLIYLRGRDKNITRIAGFIRRFGFFPLLGAARGLRQPVHAEDVAAACARALSLCTNRLYCLSGGETLTFREMVERVFASMGRQPRLLMLPRWVFAAGGRRTMALAERMNQDFVFDHCEAAREIGFIPRPFTP